MCLVGACKGQSRLRQRNVYVMFTGRCPKCLSLSTTALHTLGVLDSLDTTFLSE